MGMFDFIAPKPVDDEPPTGLQMMLKAFGVDMSLFNRVALQLSELMQRFGSALTEMEERNKRIEEKLNAILQAQSSGERSGRDQREYPILPAPGNVTTSTGDMAGYGDGHWSVGDRRD